MLEKVSHTPGGRVPGIAVLEPPIGKFAQALGGGLAFGDFRGIFVAKLVEREGEGCRQPGGAVNGLAMGAEQAAHLRLVPQSLLGIREGCAAQILDLHADADRGQHVRELAAGAVMHAGGCGGDGRKADPPRKPGEIVEAFGVLPVIAGAHHEMAVPGKAA